VREFGDRFRVEARGLSVSVIVQEVDVVERAEGRKWLDGSG